MICFEAGKTIMSVTETYRVSTTLPKKTKAAVSRMARRHNVSISQALRTMIEDALRDSQFVPNAETVAAMEESDRISRDPNVKGYTDIDHMMKEILSHV